MLVLIQTRPLVKYSYHIIVATNEVVSVPATLSYIYES